VGCGKAVDGFYEFRGGVHKVGDVISYRQLHKQFYETGQIIQISGDRVTLDNGTVLSLRVLNECRAHSS
jgi:hypothetical protein